MDLLPKIQHAVNATRHHIRAASNWLALHRSGACAPVRARQTAYYRVARQLADASQPYRSGKRNFEKRQFAPPKI
jgi:hypothetical protein